MKSKRPRKQKEDRFERDKNGTLIEKEEYRNIPGHHMGQEGTGYHLDPDGSYRIAPCELESLNLINSERNAIHRLIADVQRNAMERLTALEQRQSDWFARICRNVYRPDDALRACYNPTTGTLTFSEERPASIKNTSAKKKEDT